MNKTDTKKPTIADIEKAIDVYGEDGFIINASGRITKKGASIISEGTPLSIHNLEDLLKALDTIPELETELKQSQEEVERLSDYVRFSCACRFDEQGDTLITSCDWHKEKQSQITTLEECNKKMREALEFYDAQVSKCRKLTNEGDKARHTLDRDGGQKAKQALVEDE